MIAHILKPVMRTGLAPIHNLGVYFSSQRCVNFDLCWNFAREIPVVVDMKVSVTQNTGKNWWIQKPEWGSVCCTDIDLIGH